MLMNSLSFSKKWNILLWLVKVEEELYHACKSIRYTKKIARGR